MNWKIVLSLSGFGLLMAFATVYFISSTVEPFCWLAIFLVCAYMIQKNASGKYFLHGFLISLINCVWITCVHILLEKDYIAHHVKELAGYTKMNEQFGLSITSAMLITGPVIGIISGVFLGLFSIVAQKIFKGK